MDCMALYKWIRWLYFHGLGGSATMEYSLDKFIFSCSISFISFIYYTAIFKKKRVNFWNSVCPHGISFFRFLFISVFFRYHPSSCHLSLTSSKALEFAFAFFFKSIFKVSMFAVIDAISVFKDAIVSCFSAIWNA